MNADSETLDHARARRISVADGLLYAAMMGLCESYLGTFAVELGHGARALAWLVALPLLIGAVSQLGAAPLCRWVGSRRRLLVLGAAVQAFCCLALAWIAATGSRSLFVLLAVKTLFWMAGLVINAPWSDWMASVVPEAMRARYFGRRSGAVHGVLLLAFGLGGWLLQSGADTASLFVRYQWMFVAAAVARAGSALLLGMQPDPAASAGPSGELPRARLRLAFTEGQWRAPLYLAALMFGAYIAVPFFTPYMLEVLKLNYGAYAGLTAASILTKAAAFAVCHSLALRFGQRALMVMSGTLIALVPLAWVVAQSRLALVGAEVLSGAAWAGMEYASFQVLLASAPERARTEFLALAGTASGLAQLAGGMLGSALLERRVMDYADVFALSALLRGVALLVLVWGLWRHIQPKKLFLFALRIISVRPAGGTLSRPVAP